MAFLTIPVNFYRLQAEALDTTEVHSTYHSLTSYATTSPYVYYGQVCSVIDDGAYIINSDKSVTKLGTGSSTQSKQYKSEYYGMSATYIGTSPIGTLETDPLWTIKKSIFSSTGTFISSASSVNIAWTDRYTL
jgi:hypothetical protein